MAHPPHEPPRLPTLEDEAPDTPNWVPLLGLGLLVALFLVLAVGRGGDAVDDAAAAEAAPAPDAEAPPAEGPAPTDGEQPAARAVAAPERPTLRLDTARPAAGRVPIEPLRLDPPPAAP